MFGLLRGNSRFEDWCEFRRRKGSSTNHILNELDSHRVEARSRLNPFATRLRSDHSANSSAIAETTGCRGLRNFALPSVHIQPRRQCFAPSRAFPGGFSPHPPAMATSLVRPRCRLLNAPRRLYRRVSHPLPHLRRCDFEKEQRTKEFKRVPMIRKLLLSLCHYHDPPSPLPAGPPPLCCFFYKNALRRRHAARTRSRVLSPLAARPGHTP